MSTLYPNNIDDNISIPQLVDRITRINASSVNPIREAIIAVEKELGINPSGQFSSVTERMDHLTNYVLQCNNGASATYPNRALTQQNNFIPIVENRNFTYIGGNTTNNTLLWNNSALRWESNPVPTVSEPDNDQPLTPPIISSNQNNYYPSNFDGYQIIRLSSSADINITGLQRGTRKILINIGSFNISLINSSTLSLNENRFIFPQTIILIPNQTINIKYDTYSLKWRLG